MLIVDELKLKLSQDESALKELIKKRLHLKDNNFKYEIYRKSIYVKDEIFFNYRVLVEIDNENKYLSHKGVTRFKKENTKAIHITSDIRPIIIGYGPSGMFAAIRFAEAGLKPIIIEKGKRIEERVKDVEKFFNEAIFNPNSNIQFGEGGAGTFSDAKLTTRIKHPLIDYITDTFIKFGANKEIKYVAHAHIGTDEIRKIITKITNSLISQGAEFHFNEEAKDFIIKDNKLLKVITNNNEYDAPYCLLGIGHSAYNTIKVLYDKGVSIESKDMAIGFRVEHPQSLIDDNQYNGIKSDKLEAAEYFLRYKDDKGVYSFCMCPGGMIVPANSDANRIVTNGMSYSSRDLPNANSAILVQVTKDEYGEGTLAGFNYLKDYETKAYSISNSYKALAQNVKDYLNNELNPLIRQTSYPLGTYLYNLNDFFTNEQNKYFHKALLDFDNKIPGFIEQGVMIGPETRSSCPIRILRNENGESVNTYNLYPMGEGAGYGGGIMSCALDGVKCADKVLLKISNSL